MARKFKISVCMMVKNEEKNLKRCLESIKPLINSGIAELIIVDTGSEDNTVKVAEAYTDKVFFHPWNNNFSDMRNITISYATGEWLFILDADERLDSSHTLVNIFNEEEFMAYNALLLTVKNLYSLKDENNYNILVSPRLFRNNGKVRYQGSVHNQVIYEGKALKLDVSLTHYGYITLDKELMEKKFLRTSSLLKQEIEKDPNNIYYIYQLGVSYSMHGDARKALNEYRKAYKLLEKMLVAYRKKAFFVYGAYAREACIIREYKESITIAEEAIKLQPDYVDMYYTLGHAYKSLGEEKKAIEKLKRYLEKVNKYDSLSISRDLSITMYTVNGAVISQVNNELFKHYYIYNSYQEAYKYYKELTDAKQKIQGIELLIKLDKVQEIVDLYEHLDDQESKELFVSILEGILINVENEDLCEKIYSSLSNIKGIYGMFNGYKKSQGFDKKRLAKELINIVDFNKNSVIYAKIFDEYVNDIDCIIDALLFVEPDNVKEIIHYITTINKKILNSFEEYIIRLLVNRIDMSKGRIVLQLMNFLLIKHSIESEEIADKYQEIFKKYLELGSVYIKNIYKLENATSIYKNIISKEEKFFVTMYLAKESLISEEKVIAIRYYKEAVKCYKNMIKYMELYKNEFLENINTSNNQKAQDDFENDKKAIKNSIRDFIDKESYLEALSLIKEYEQIVPNDIEIIFFKTQIAVAEL